MTDKHVADSHLDAAIDRAVREMMSVEPRADLRHRVMAELAGEPTRTALWPRLAFASVALAAAVIVVLMLVNRPAERPVDQTIAGTRPPAAAPGNTGGPTGPVTGTAPKVGAGGPAIVEGPKPRTVAPRPAIEDRPVQAASIDTTERIAIEPMAPVERLRPISPIVIARLETSQVAAEISIKPITLERIEITPLTPPR